MFFFLRLYAETHINIILKNLVFIKIMFLKFIHRFDVVVVATLLKHYFSFNLTSSYLTQPVVQTGAFFRLILFC